MRRWRGERSETVTMTRPQGCFRPLDTGECGRAKITRAPRELRGLYREDEEAQACAEEDYRHSGLNRVVSRVSLLIHRNKTETGGR